MVVVFSNGVVSMEEKEIFILFISNLKFSFFSLYFYFDGLSYKKICVWWNIELNLFLLYGVVLYTMKKRIDVFTVLLWNMTRFFYCNKHCSRIQVVIKDKMNEYEVKAPTSIFNFSYRNFISLSSVTQIERKQNI